MSDKKHKIYCTYQEAPQHHFRGHPESPTRVRPMGEWLKQPPYPEIEWMNFEPAEEGEIALVHQKGLLDYLKSESQQGPHEFEPAPSYVTRTSYQNALGAVGACLAVSRRILSEESGRGFAIVRPPGHHAEPSSSMGFCLLNNVAVAAADAVASGVSKVAIIDFDAHHGNGTQAAFWETPEVGYLSTHESHGYPGTGQVRSAPHARGRIVNIPLPSFAGNAAFKKILEGVVEPWLARFQPEMIFVSAGYDGHFSDPLTTLTLDTRGYFELTQTLVMLAETHGHARIMFALEGGYDPQALQDNIQACLAGLIGREDFGDRYGKGPDVTRDVDSLIQEIRSIHHL